jgi:large subunit ribosomal protein L15
MSLEEILSAPTGRKARLRVGRGSGSGIGKTCGRGHKGSGSRAGGKDQHPLYEGGQFPLWQRLPKRGFSNFAHETRYQAIDLAKAVERIQGDITIETLVACGLARKGANIKLVAGVTVDRVMKIAVHKVTKSVRAAVEAAGGSVVTLHA